LRKYLFYCRIYIAFERETAQARSSCPYEYNWR
jgi:hypothetical protein